MTDSNPLDKKFYAPENLKQTWEYKTIRFLLRGFLTLAVYYMLVHFWQPMQHWAEMKYVRMQELSQLQPLLDRAKATGDYEDALAWTSLRPRTETPAILKVIEKNATDLPAAFFFSAATKSQVIRDAENYARWNLIARYRMRYDILRCGNPDLVEKFDSISLTMSRVYGARDALDTLLNDKPRLVAGLKDVLAFDADHPAHNNPQLTCAFLKPLNEGVNYVPVPESAWATIRHSLRNVTDYEIGEMEKSANAEKSAPKNSTPGDKAPEESDMVKEPSPPKP